jgi:hypothetical protein
MALRWTVIVEIDPGLASALRERALDAITRIADASDVQIRDRSSAPLVGMASDRASADQFAQSALAIDSVTAAYVKPPELLP